MRSAAVSLLFGVVVTALSYPAFSHDQTKPDEPYHQTDLQEVHAIVETVRATAGPEQLGKIDQLVSATGPELQRLSKRAIVAHRQKVELMLEDVVDRHAFEEAQANELNAAGALSKRIDDALTSLAKILTPEQRSYFRDHINPREH